MATSPFTKIPTEMVSAITSFLSVWELQKFRLVSRWAQHESFSDYSNRRLARILIREVTGKSMLRRARLVEERPNYASAVKDLEVWFYNPGPSTWAKGLKEAASEGANAPKHCSKLPSLERLALVFLDGPRLAIHLLPRLQTRTASASAWSNLQDLEVSHSGLKSTEWQALLGVLIGLNLRTLFLWNVHSTEGGWLSVFDTIQRLLDKSEALLKFSNITFRRRESTQPHHADDALYFADNEHGVIQPVGSPASSNAWRLGRTRAIMKGPEGVKSGLDAVKQYVLAGGQDTW
ncbi:hypothetical protein LTR15_010089 [Elasticomyces elasticus]|nr:hypothetical protein LTR15_010089 [Elasticomyces elasticus]